MITLAFKTTAKKRVSAALVGALIAVLLIPAGAGAQRSDPTIDQYEPSITRITNGAGEGENGRGTVGPLPFTGFDVITMAAVALAVTGLGLGLQRAVSRPPGDSAG